jgi:pimeloyl-ACP methyl ester carboxylesterase
VAQRLWQGAALVSVGLAGGAAIVTARHLMLTPQPLDSGLPGEGRIDRRHGGDIYYTVAGPQDARPVVLLHGFYPGASSYEFRLVFARLAETYRVYAPDWLGFGMSERPALTHTGEFCAAMLQGFLRDVVGAPAAVVAHGLAGNIATRVASDAPELFDRLTLVAPEAEAGMRIDPTPQQTLTRLAQKLALGLTPYAISSLRPALRLAAGRRSAAGAREVDDATLDHLYASAHQFGGEHAALSLFTGELDLPIANIFPLLRTPTLIMIGARDQHHALPEMERLVALNRGADLEMISNAGETVYLDQPTLFMHTLHRWLGRRIVRHERPAAPQAVASASAAPVASPVAAPTRLTPPIGAPAASPVSAPSARPAKVVPVLEPTLPGDPAPPAQPALELEVNRMPDGEALDNSADAADAPRPLSLEPTNGPSTRQVKPEATAARHAPAHASGHALGVRPAQASASQGGAYLYAPELRAHILRPDQSEGTGPSRQSRGQRMR